MTGDRPDVQLDQHGNPRPIEYPWEHGAAHVPAEFEIELYDGTYLDLDNPDPDLITIDQIAYALPHVKRYCGQSASPISVAEHAVRVAAWLRAWDHPPERQLQGLHHDDAEAFIGDISRPLRRLLGPTIEVVDDTVTAAIWTALDLPERSPEDRLAITKADLWALAHEAAESFPDRAAGWQCMAHRDDWPEGLKKPIPIALAPLSARELWLEWDLSLRSEIARAEDPDA